MRRISGEVPFPEGEIDSSIHLNASPFGPTMGLGTSRETGNRIHPAKLQTYFEEGYSDLFHVLSIYSNFITLNHFYHMCIKIPVFQKRTGLLSHADKEGFT